jgi:hypothetical protein
MDFREAYTGGEFLDAMDIIGTPLSTLILDVRLETLENKREGTTDEKPVVQLFGTPLRFILNKTNYKSITRVCGTPKTDQWKGRVIEIIAVPHPKSDSGYALRVSRMPENVIPFLQDATSLDDLKQRHVLLGSRSDNKVIKEIAKKWKD